MKFIENVKNKIKLINEAEYWKKQAETYKAEYKREMLMNQAYSHAILQAVLSGKITGEQQRLIYDLVNNESRIIYEKLLK